VELRAVTLIADGRRLFEGTSLSIFPGEHAAIVGPNGSGKSVLARALWDGVLAVEGVIAFPLAEQEAAREGSTTGAFDAGVRHVCLSDQDALRRRGSAYLQGRYESLEDEGAPTVADLLGGAGGSGSPRRPGLPAAAELLARFAVGHTLGRAACRLSNGEMRKLLLVRALLDGPRLLVIEEPLQGLDPASRREVTRTLRAVASLGVTLVTVSARLPDVPLFARRLIRVEAGKIVPGSTRPFGPGLFRRRPRSPRAGAPAGAGLPLAPGAPDGSAGGPVIELREVTVRWGAATALDRVSWTVRQGEGWAVVGPNGAGKTTLLSLVLADNPQAYANDVRVFGMQRGEGHSIWELKALVGHVSPEAQAHLPAGLTLLATILSGLTDSLGPVRSPTEGELARAREWAAAVGLALAEDRLYGEVSEGEKRLALIARALVKGPRLLVLDEPCQGLDEEHRSRVRAIVDRLVLQGRTTVLYVTHEAEEIPRCVRSVLRLERGRVRSCVRRGTPAAASPRRAGSPRPPTR
jgi:molybdate transport system ATP-binding protein